MEKSIKAGFCVAGKVIFDNDISKLHKKIWENVLEFIELSFHIVYMSGWAFWWHLLDLQSKLMSITRKY